MKWTFSVESMRLSPRFFFFIGSGIMYADSHYPYPFMHISGRDSWLVMLVGGFAAVVLIGWIGTRIIRYLPERIVTPQHPPMPGMAVWRGVHFITALWAWWIAAWSLNRFTEFIQNEMMPLTPLSVFLIGLLLLTVWGGIYGLEAGGRIITLCSLTVFPLPLVYILLVFRQVHLQWLLPIAQESRFWMGCLLALSFFLQAAPLCVLFQLAEDRRRALRALLIGLSLSVVTSAVVRVFVVCVLNPYLAPYYAAPDYAAIRLIRLAESIDRVELPLVWLWSYASWAKVLLYLLLGTFALLTAFRIKRWVGAHLVSTALFVGITVISIVLRPDGFSLINWLAMRYLYYINLGFQLLFLAIVTGLALFRPSRKHTARGKKPGGSSRWM